MVRTFCCLALAIQCFGFCAQAGAQDDPAGNFQPIKDKLTEDESKRAQKFPAKDHLPKAPDPEFKDYEGLRRFLIGLEISTYEATKAKPAPLSDVLADDFTMFNSDGTKTNKRQLLETLGDEPSATTYSNFSVRLLGKEGALVTYTTKGPPSDPPAVDHGTITTSAWERRDGKWQLVFCQMLALPGEAPRGVPADKALQLDSPKAKTAEAKTPEDAKKADDAAKPEEAKPAEAKPAEAKPDEKKADDLQKE